MVTVCCDIVPWPDAGLLVFLMMFGQIGVQLMEFSCAPRANTHMKDDTSSPRLWAAELSVSILKHSERLVPHLIVVLCPSKKGR